MGIRHIYTRNDCHCHPHGHEYHRPLEQEKTYRKSILSSRYYGIGESEKLLLQTIISQKLRLKLQLS